jgi:hypothetical protein
MLDSIYSGDSRSRPGVPWGCDDGEVCTSDYCVDGECVYLPRLNNKTSVTNSTISDQARGLKDTGSVSFWECWLVGDF